MTHELDRFNSDQIGIVNESSAMAEDLVNDYYKMSASQWTKPKYDVKTLTDLTRDEIVFGPFAQVLRYEGKRKDRHLGSEAYDYYKICLQDHSILSVLEKKREIELFPFILYNVAHELIHVVRFRKFLQSFYASSREIMAEETRVHESTMRILRKAGVPGMESVVKFYERWSSPS